MEYCKYHPLTAATYHCEHCQISLCDHCIDDDPEYPEPRCFVCGGEVDSLGSADIAPFWRRLDSAFQYPMNKQTILLIMIASVLTSIGAFIGGITGFCISLAITAITTKYSFLCLQGTTMGVLRAPDMNEAFSGGFKIIWHIIVILIVISLMISGVERVFGGLVAVLFLIFWIVCLPAVFINYARFEDIGPAINPIEIGRLVVTLGSAYLLLLLFITIMMASVGTLHEILDEQFYFFSAVLQSIVSYYYLIVIFHLMGYLIFQKQKALGFSSRLESSTPSDQRSEKNRVLSKVDILTKEGDFEGALATFKQGTKIVINDYDFYSRFFDFLCGIKRIKEIDNLLVDYLAILKNYGRENLLTTVYQRILLLDKQYVPASPEVRYQLALGCFDSGKSLFVVKLLNGLHRDFPDYKELIPAYELMAKALDDLPNKEHQAEKFRGLVRQLKGASTQD